MDTRTRSFHCDAGRFTVTEVSSSWKRPAALGFPGRSRKQTQLNQPVRAGTTASRREFLNGFLKWVIKAGTGQSGDCEAEEAKAQERGCRRSRPQALRRPLKTRSAPTSQGPRRTPSVPPPGEQRCGVTRQQPRARPWKDAGSRRSRAAPVAGGRSWGQGTRGVLSAVRATGRADGLRETLANQGTGLRGLFGGNRHFGKVLTDGYCGLHVK